MLVKWHKPSRCIGLVSSLRVGRIPGGAKDVERLCEDVIVDESSVNGEESHQEHNVTTIKYSAEHLQ